MATDFNEIQKYLAEFELEYTYNAERGYVRLGFTSQGYSDPEGQKRYHLVIELREDGALLDLFVPMLYRYQGPHRDALFAAFARIQGNAKLGRYAYDPEDGEVRLNTTVALEDGELTRKMLHRFIDATIWAVEHYDRTLRTAMETGRVEMPDPGRDKAAEPEGPRVVN